MFFDVGFDRKEIVIDKIRNFIVSVGFGLQPNTCASSRSRTEIKQHRLLVGLCLSKRNIKVFDPLNSHFRILL